jgi:hypothetical protein
MLGILLSINVGASLSLRLSLADHVGHVQAPKAHSLGVFTSVVVIVCVGALVVTIQAKVSTGQFCTCDSPVLCCFSFSAAGCTFHLSLVVWFLVLRNVHRSFFQGLCALGYCVAPLDIAALVSCFVRTIYVRAPVAILAWAWCIWGELRTYPPSTGKALTPLLSFTQPRLISSMGQK